MTAFPKNWFAAVATLAMMSGAALAGAAPAPVVGDVTFSRDIAPILQRSCQNCHHAGRRGADVTRHLR